MNNKKDKIKKDILINEVENIIKLSKLYDLKSVYRLAKVIDNKFNRNESSAEHTWSCLLLADFLLDKCIYKEKINKLRVFELLIYHDIVEIESGDFPLHPNKELMKQRKNMKEIAEKQAITKIIKNMPKELANKIKNNFNEFENMKTLESRFAKAIDALDAMIQSMKHSESWEDYSYDFLYKHKMKYFTDFPQLKKIFLGFMNYLKENNYFRK